MIMMMSMSRIALSGAMRPVLSRRAGLACVSTWANVQAGPPDPILGVTEAFKRDSDPIKINLGVGAYRDENGKPYVLPAVREADKRIANADLDKEYLPITGLGTFDKLAAELAYGPQSKPVAEDRLAKAQSISGTGALRIACLLYTSPSPRDKRQSRMPSSA